MEDEAVVAELLLRAGGSLKLLDVSDRLPELVRVPGVRRWRVRDKHQWYNSWQEAEKVHSQHQGMLLLQALTCQHASCTSAHVLLPPDLCS